MPCTFDIKPEDRNCEYCTVRNCDSREPKEPETYATTHAEIIDDLTIYIPQTYTSREWTDYGSLSLEFQLFNELMLSCQQSCFSANSWDCFGYLYRDKKETLLSNLRVELKDRWQRRKGVFYKNQV